VLPTVESEYISISLIWRGNACACRDHPLGVDLRKNSEAVKKRFLAAFFVHFPVEMGMKDYRLTHFAQQFARHTIEARP